MASLLDSAGLGHRMAVPAADLSAGQRRRLLLIGALSRPFRLLLLDEPERALDMAGLAWLVDRIGAATAAGAAVVLASHSRTLVRDCGADVVALA